MDEIKHHGVKGMKWGVRKDRKKLSDMSDQELRDYNNRKKLENEYKKLNYPVTESYKNKLVGAATGAAAVATVAIVRKYGKKYLTKAALYVVKGAI